MRSAIALVAASVLAALLVVITPAEPASAAAPLTQLWRVEIADVNDSSAPTIGDVNRDGVDDIIFGTLDGKVHVYQADGSLLWSRPAIIAGQTSASAINSAPLVIDLDKDGDVEIIVGVGSLKRVNQQGGIVALDHNGNRIWSHQGFDTFNQWTGGPQDGFTEGVYSSPAAGDVDGDGFLDIVFGGWDHRIWALNRNGVPVSGFPFVHYDTTWGSPALYDIDGDGRDEIYIGGDASIGLDFTHEGGRFRVLDWQGSIVSERFPAIERDDIFQSSSVMADINNDGRMDVIVGGTAGAFTGTTSPYQVWAFHADNGSMLPGFPVTLPNKVFSTPAIGDVDGDGALEIVVNTMSEGSVRGKITVIESNGSVKYAAEPLAPDFAGAGINYMASPIIIDADGDGDLDIVSTSDVFTFIVDGKTGTRLPGGRLNQNEAWAGAGSPLAADFGARGWQLIVPTFSPSANKTYLTAYALPNQPSTGTWTMWRGYRDHSAAPAGTQNAQPVACRTGSNPTSTPSHSSASGYWILHDDGSVDALDAPHYGDLRTTNVNLAAGVRAVAITETHSGNGYWILDSAGVVYTFGDAVNHGSMAGVALAAPIISMSALPTGDGYWLLGSDGGVFSFKAGFYGSTGGMRLDAPVISMAPTATGRGYWLLASDGGVFSFGDAKFKGSTGGMRLDAPVISMAVSPDGRGYWLLAVDGGVFSFAVTFYGSVPGLGLCNTPTAIELRPTSTGRGYFALNTNGSVIAFGDAYNRGSSSSAAAPVDLAVRG